MINITISARQKSRDMPVKLFLEKNFKSIPYEQIDSLFGFSDPCRMYGGRSFSAAELADRDLRWMYDNGIGYRIPVTSFLVNRELYEEAKPFLTKHHRQGNSVIVVRDNLAQWVKEDFPLYKVECSVIKEVDNAEKLLKALELYDTVVPLPEVFNTNYELLESFSSDIKDRIRLFLNSGCAYKCPARTCYGSFSKMNRGDADAVFLCSQMSSKKYIPPGMINFDMESFIKIGYTKFKLLRVKKEVTGY